MSFRLADEGRVLLRRITPIPGFTPESSLLMLMRESGYDYPEAINKLISLAIDTDA